jgi:TPR repeat protein
LYLSGAEVPKDVTKAVDLLVKSANQDNSYAEYTLGKLYLYGKEIQQNTEQAKYWLERSAEHGNQYAKQLLERQSSAPSLSAFSLASGLLHHLSRIMQNNYNHRYNNRSVKVDKKVRNEIAEKKAALGIKDEGLQQGM